MKFVAGLVLGLLLVLTALFLYLVWTSSSSDFGGSHAL
jgi:hypothetical protein